jgi:DNA-binding GntR family transcriptional regulator
VAPFRFSHAAALSALYAIGLDAAHFQQLGETRKALEIQFWDQAVTLLTREDIVCLRDLIAAAHDHLMSEPIVVPAREHRAFHLTIFSHLDNLFVLGLLEAFWDAYEAFGLNLYRALDYHQTVWDYHRRMVDAIEAGEFEFGRQLLIEHMNLIRYRSQHTIHPPSSRTEGVNDIQFE